MTATPDQKYQLTIPQRKLRHVPGFSHSGEKQVCITHISHWLVGPPSQITPTECKEKPPAPTKTILISQQPWKPDQNQEKPAVANSFWRTYHHQAKLLVPCLHLSSALCTLICGHHLLSHILQESLPSQQRWTSSREVSNSLCAPWSHLL